jgi:hypothetical protein
VLAEALERGSTHSKLHLGSDLTLTLPFAAAGVGSRETKLVRNGRLSTAHGILARKNLSAGQGIVGIRVVNPQMNA